MTRIIFWLVVMVVTTTGSSNAQSVVAQGEAIVDGQNTLVARQQALAVAFRHAIEKGLGIYVQGQTLVQNAALLADNIYTKSQGYIRQHEIINEGLDASTGMYRVQIRADVNSEQLGMDLRSLGILKDMMSNPKILSLIEGYRNTKGQQERIEDNSAALAIETTLIDQQFDLLDREQVQQIRAAELSRMGEFYMERAFDDGEMIMRLAKRAQEQGAQYLIMGQATYGIDHTLTMGATVQATIRCRVVDASTAEKIAVAQAAEVGRGQDFLAAELFAGNRAGKVVADKIVPQIIKNWSRRMNDGVVYNIKLYGIESYGLQGRKFMQIMQSIPGVTSCAKRMWDADLGRLEIDVAFKGSGETLLDGIFDAVSMLKGFELFDLEEQTGNNMNFKLK